MGRLEYVVVLLVALQDCHCSSLAPIKRCGRVEEVPDNLIGLLIGKHGAGIKQLQALYGCPGLYSYTQATLSWRVGLAAWGFEPLALTEACWETALTTKPPIQIANERESDILGLRGIVFGQY